MPTAAGTTTLACVACAGDEKEVVRGDDEDGEERAGGAASAAGLGAERNGDEGEREAGDRESETLVEFDAGIEPVGTEVVQKLEEGTLGEAD